MTVGKLCQWNVKMIAIPIFHLPKAVGYVFCPLWHSHTYTYVTYMLVIAIIRLLQLVYGCLKAQHHFDQCISLIFRLSTILKYWLSITRHRLSNWLFRKLATYHDSYPFQDAGLVLLDEHLAANGDVLCGVANRQMGIIKLKLLEKWFASSCVLIKVIEAAVLYLHCFLQNNKKIRSTFTKLLVAFIYFQECSNICNRWFLRRQCVFKAVSTNLCGPNG